VSNGVASLVNTGEEGDPMDVLLIVIEGWRELWSWWINVVGRSEHDDLMSVRRVLILLWED
jgi:hypothetical protein